MAAANGFVTTRPDARYGDSDSQGNIRAQKFTVPGSGTQEIGRIGLWAVAAANDLHLRLAIFTHDAVNDCPDAMVANSLSDAIDMPRSTYQEHTFEYATKPQVTGGATYWLAVIPESIGDSYYSRFASGGSSLAVTTFTYPTFPSGDEWHTHVDTAQDFSFYAVYGSSAPTASPSQLALLGVG